MVQIIVGGGEVCMCVYTTTLFPRLAHCTEVCVAYESSFIEISSENFPFN